MRFLICLLLYFGFSIFLYISLAESSNSPLIAFLVLKFALPCKLFPPPSSMSSVDTENRQGYDSLTFFCFFLNVFHF